jgi:hypothetical protein
MVYWRLTRIGLFAVALGLVAVAGASAQERDAEPGDPGVASGGQLLYALMDGSNSILMIDPGGTKEGTRT